MKEEIIGSSRSFVLAKGFTQVGQHVAIIGEDDTKRLFAEISANPDRAEARPEESYQAILASMQPGWTLRVLQLFWPDPEPRLAFQKQIQNLRPPDSEGLDILYQALLLAVQEYPLPFSRRTILEFVLPGEEGLAWWEGLSGLCASFGLQLQYLDQADIEALATWVFNPRLSYDGL